MKRNLLFIVERLASLLEEPRLQMLVRQHRIREKRDGGAIAKTFAAYRRSADENTLGRALVESAIRGGSVAARLRFGRQGPRGDENQGRITDRRYQANGAGSSRTTRHPRGICRASSRAKRTGVSSCTVIGCDSLGGSRRVEFRIKVNSDATWMNAASSGLR
jgi:hypothetical protein